MIENRKGLIINAASLAELIGHMFSATNSASKHALIGFSKSIRTSANLSENFYDKTSPLFEYNRGLLRLMLNKIVPRAADPKYLTRQVVLRNPQ